MKSYTDIEQSKKLAEILPLESADMFYRDNGIDVKLIWEHIAQKVTNPCWSLAALLDALPKIYNLKPILDLEENSILYSGIDIYVHADNPIDACVDMIFKLKEKNLL